MTLYDFAILFLTCTAIFAAVMAVTRIAGLRTFAKMSSVDFASTIAIGSVIASTILSEKTSILYGSATIAIIVFLQVLSARLMKRFDWYDKIASNKPLLLMRDGDIIQENLDRSGVSRSDLIAKLREANALRFENVKAVIFETTGDIAVLHGSDDIELDLRLLYGVEKYAEDN